MRNELRATLLAPVISLAILAGCGSDEPATRSTAAAPSPARTAAASGPRPNYAPPNPYMADSVVPVGHINSAQSTGVDIAGPSGPSEELSQENGGLTYTHLGPGHFGYAISLPEWQAGNLEQRSGPDFQARLRHPGSHRRTLPGELTGLHSQ